MVVLSFTVTDSQGQYVNGLKPNDFKIFEDGILQKVTTFAEGAKPPVHDRRRRIGEAALKARWRRSRASRASIRAWTPSSAPTSSSCSTPAISCIADSCMPKMRSPISCAAWIAPIRLPSTRSAAISRARPRLTRERNDAIMGLRKSVAGDDTALYNALLLTLRDAAKVPGRKVVIVFSNGPDNASMVTPDDVRSVAEDEGIPIYVISTNEVNKDPISSGVFRRIATRTGGKAYWAKTWQKQVEAFEIDPRRSGQLVYGYLLPAAQSERRFPQDRRGDRVGSRKKLRVRKRPGYRPKGGF